MGLFSGLSNPNLTELEHHAFVLVSAYGLPFFQLISEKQASGSRFYPVLALKNLLDGGIAHSLGFRVFLPVVVQDLREQLPFGVRCDVFGIGDGDPGTSPASYGTRLLHHPASNDGHFRIGVQNLLERRQFPFCGLPLFLKAGDLVRQLFRPGQDLPLPNQRSAHRLEMGGGV